MVAAGCDIEVHLYDDTPHSFMNALTPEGVAFLDKWGYGVPPKEQVQLAFDTVMAFFDRHLKSSSAGTSA
jgi:dienelactone hydrolase